MSAQKLYMPLAALLLFVYGGFSFYCTNDKTDNFSRQDMIALTAKIDLPNVSGRIDHIAYDSFNHLAFIASLGNNTIEVVNINTKQVVHTITGLHEPQGVAFIPLLQRLVVANGYNGDCVFFDTKNYTVINTIKLKGDADNIRYDAANNLLYVGYGNGAIGIIDATQMKLINSILLDGHPESFQLSKKLNRIYINVPDADEIEVADLSTHTVIFKWKNTIASSNFPMALDENNNRLFIGCRNPATLRMINTETGKDITSIKCSGDADDIFYYNNLVFVSAGKGYIDVFEASNNVLKQINHIETSNGSRTSLLLPSEKKLLLAVPAHSSNSAALWVYNLN
jgi:outer membrane protein assembly factor BamB